MIQIVYVELVKSIASLINIKIYVLQSDGTANTATIEPSEMLDIQST